MRHVLRHVTRVPIRNRYLMLREFQSTIQHIALDNLRLKAQTPLPYCPFPSCFQFPNQDTRAL